MASVREIREKLVRIWPHLNERSRRMLAATEAVGMGYGGVSLVSRVCGLSRVTITKGISELAEPPLPEERIRRAGGGRWKLVVRDPKLVEVLDSLVEPLSRGDPESPLRWTCKSTRTLAGELTWRRHPVSHEKVAQLLREMDYSLQGNRKTEEGADHSHRDAQFQYIIEPCISNRHYGHKKGGSSDPVMKERSSAGRLRAFFVILDKVPSSSAM